MALREYLDLTFIHPKRDFRGNFFGLKKEQVWKPNFGRATRLIKPR